MEVFMRARHACLCSVIAAAVVAASIGVGAEQPLSLIEAVKKGDVATARMLSRQAALINAREVDGTTALHWAVHRDDLAMVDLLIAAGVEVSAVNRYGVMPLALACTNGNAAIVERLLRAGADVNAHLAGGEAMIMTASRTGVVDVVQTLIAHGADVNVREQSKGQTALMWAAAKGNTATVKILLHAGANLGIRSGEAVPGATAGPAAAPPKPVTLVGFNPAINTNLYGNPSQIDGFTALLFAVRNGELGTVRALLDEGASVNDTASNGISALTVAAINAHWELGAFLLDRGADPNASVQGWTPLHQVVRTRNLSVGHLPHPVATGQMSSVEFAKKLLAHGANVNARITTEMKDGYRGRFLRLAATPLLLAAKGSDHEMMRLLIANGADGQLTNAIGTNALMLAAGVDTVFPGEDTGTPEDGLEAVKVALTLGLDVNAANGNGDTALHGAAFRGLNQAVQLLVDKGARLDAKNNKGFTPLQTADADFVGTILQHQPETAALLRQLMEARGLSAQVLTWDEVRTRLTVGVSTVQ
jgi:ankyrin repeat protein